METEDGSGGRGRFGRQETKNRPLSPPPAGAVKKEFETRKGGDTEPSPVSSHCLAVHVVQMLGTFASCASSSSN